MTQKSESLSRWHLGALALYAALAVLFINHGVNLSRFIAGQGTDPYLFVWFLAWWPHALLHHLNLLYTPLVWQPLGAPVLWLTSIPLLGILLAPLTYIAGPVVVYNLIILAAPVLSATSAYFLCLRVSRNPLAAIFGGYLFGFSSYEMAQGSATLNQSLTFLLPCLVIVALRRLSGEAGRCQTVILASVTMLAEFFISQEVFTMIAVFAGAAWLLAYWLLASARVGLRGLLGDAVIAGSLTAIIMAPLLVEMFRHAHYLNLPAIWPYYFVADLANFIFPTGLTWLGGHWDGLVTKHMPGILQEQGAYIGLPVVFILLSYMREMRHVPAAKYLLTLWLSLAVASLGPQLWVAGIFTGVFLPWAIVMHLPLLGMALPARFILFVSLVTAIIGAFWLAQTEMQPLRWRRRALSALACLALLPGLHPRTLIPAAKFFAPGEVQAQLGANPRLLILPFWRQGPSSYWQVENNFGFTQTGGYLGFPPKAMQHFNAIWEMAGNIQVPDFPANFTSFCEQTNTQYVVAGPGTSAEMLAFLADLHWPSRQVDDVTVFTVPRTVHG